MGYIEEWDSDTEEDYPQHTQLISYGDKKLPRPDFNLCGKGLYLIDHYSNINITNSRDNRMEEIQQVIEILGGHQLIDSRGKLVVRLADFYGPTISGDPSSPSSRGSQDSTSLSQRETPSLVAELEWRSIPSTPRGSDNTLSPFERMSMENECGMSSDVSGSSSGAFHSDSDISSNASTFPELGHHNIMCSFSNIRESQSPLIDEEEGMPTQGSQKRTRSYPCRQRSVSTTYQQSPPFAVEKEKETTSRRETTSYGRLPHNSALEKPSS